MRGSDATLWWRELSRRRVASCSLFDLYATERSSAAGKHGEFFILAAPDWVNVVPVLRSASGETSFLMVRQYRHGADMITAEFPAGIIAPGEAPLYAAARELEEETGYRAGRMTLLGRVRPNPAFMSNWCSTFLAEDLVRFGDGAPDELEELEVAVVPVTQVEAAVGGGEYVNSLALVALLLYHRRLAGTG